MSSLKITLRLGVGFSLILMTLIFVIVAGLNKISLAQQKLDQVVNDLNVKVTTLELMTGMIKDIDIYTRDIILFTDQNEMQDHLKKILIARNIYDQAESRLDTLFESKQDKALLDKIKELRGVARPALNRAIELGFKNMNQNATDLLIKDVAPLTGERLKTLEQLIERQKELAKKTAEEAKLAYVHARILTFCLGASALALFIFVAFIFMRVAVIVDTGKSFEQIVGVDDGRLM
ncbi:MAG: MCP four helix bundle domain-containing protein [Proteobacteria bacterium]|nr:MCP four helix bundle domain-containing protein [Pseudomonadota bacterium]